MKVEDWINENYGIDHIKDIMKLGDTVSMVGIIDEYAKHELKSVVIIDEWEFSKDKNFKNVEFKLKVPSNEDVYDHLEEKVGEYEAPIYWYREC